MTQTNEEKILDILAGMSLRMDSMATKDDIAKINIKIETEILPKIDALAEGQSAILEQLTPRSRIDDMENEIRFLKTVVQRVVDDLQKLQQAQ